MPLDPNHTHADTPDAPYPGMSEAFEQHFSQSWLSGFPCRGDQ